MRAPRARAQRWLALNTGRTARERLPAYLRTTKVAFASAAELAKLRRGLSSDRGDASPRRAPGRVPALGAPMASPGAAVLQALRAAGPAPLLVALFAALALHLLLRARAPSRPRGPVTLSPGVKARPPPAPHLPRVAHPHAG